TSSAAPRRGCSSCRRATRSRKRTCRSSAISPLKRNNKASNRQPPPGAIREAVSFASPVQIHHPLHRAVEAHEIGERKLRREQEVKRKPADRLDLQLAAEAFDPGVGLDARQNSGRHESETMRLDVGSDLCALDSRRQGEDEHFSKVPL